MENYRDFDTDSLIRLVREHNDAAFSELVGRYAPLMNKIVNKFTSSRVLYDEAFSEACVALHKAALSYDFSKSDVITFGLYSNVCVYRRLCDLVSKSAKALPSADVDVDLLASESNIESRLVYRERMTEYLNKARELLSEYEYSVFVLYLEGDSTSEIADKLGKSTKSVENAKSRMLKHLRNESEAFSDI